MRTFGDTIGTVCVLLDFDAKWKTQQNGKGPKSNETVGMKPYYGALFVSKLFLSVVSYHCLLVIYLSSLIWYHLLLLFHTSPLDIWCSRERERLGLTLSLSFECTTLSVLSITLSVVHTTLSFVNIFSVNTCTEGCPY